MASKNYTAIWINQEGNEIVKKFKAEMLAFGANGSPILVNFEGPSNIYNINPAGGQEGATKSELIVANLNGASIIYEDTALVEKA